jgi:hypothetical protein
LAIQKLWFAPLIFTNSQNFKSMLIFNDRTCDIINIDLSGDLDFVARKSAAYPSHPYITKKSPASETNERDMRREVELMPRH